MGDAQSGPARVSFNPQLRVEFNGRFESVCYDPLFVFNRDGGCLTATLRPGNVHSADGRDEVLLPVIDRLQDRG